MMKYLAIVAILLFSVVVAGAPVPTPVGPPINRTDGGFLIVPFITGVFHQKVQTIIDETNASFIEAGSSTRVAIESVRALRPSRVATELKAEPNSWYVNVPHRLTIKARIAGAGDRQIHVPVDFQVSCENWQLQSGRVVMRSIPGQVTVTGGSLLEAIIGVRDRINAAIAAGFDTPAPMSAILPRYPCSSIGVWGADTADVSDDAIVWDVPRPSPIDGIALRPTIEVAFDRLKRLPARGRAGTVIYDETEEILLNLFANYDSPPQRRLTMRDGDDVALELPPMRFEAEKYQQLVIIGSVVQQPSWMTDTVFTASSRAENYAPGRHVLRITKVYYIPGSPKPSEVHVPAYEVSYAIRYLDNRLTQQANPR